jgi:GT2 family glycosyltransferase
MADRHDVAGSPHPPAAIAVAPALRAALLTRLFENDGAEARRALLLKAIAAGPVAHLPRVLVSLPLAESPATVPAVAAVPADTDSRILIVIPTRDEPEMLGPCLATLKSFAARPDLLDFLVVDNRSTAPETHGLFAKLAGDGVRIFAMDEPFNWARVNNEAASDGSQELIVFANNDTEMTTAGWDDRLRAWLEQPDVGIIGARLLYPDGALQHGGILLGGWDGRPSHDGLWAPHTEGGPLGRWRRSRVVAAVTGAFMACRRDTFQQTGGFDPRLAIAYNDIDFCLRIREIGLTVVYAADIELVHHESRTRGQNDTAEKVAWDDSELADMHRRWGDALFFDRGLNPQWASAVNRPYDGYRDLPLTRVLEHLDASVHPGRLPEGAGNVRGLTPLPPRGT